MQWSDLLVNAEQTDHHVLIMQIYKFKYHILHLRDPESQEVESLSMKLCSLRI